MGLCTRRLELAGEPCQEKLEMTIKRINVAGKEVLSTLVTLVCNRSTTFSQKELQRMVKWFPTGLAVILVAVVIVFYVSAPGKIERSAKQVATSLAELKLASRYMESLHTMECTVAETDVTKLGTYVGECYIDSPCNLKIVAHFRFDLLNGMRFGPDPFAQPFARHCPQMLTPKALMEVQNKIDQGG